MYHILTSKKNKRLLATKNYNEAYTFIINNEDAKVRTLNYDAKLKIMDKRIYLRDFYKYTNDKNRFFELTKIMVKGTTNLSDFINMLELKNDYRIYMNQKTVTNKGKIPNLFDLNK